MACPACPTSCPLIHIGTGFAPPDGPRDSDLCFLIEALGEDEAKQSKNLVGKTGQLFNRTLERLGLRRSDVRTVNSIACFKNHRVAVLTSKGYKALSSIVPGELVMTHLGRWRPVTDVLHGLAGKAEVSVTTASFIHTVTPNHRFMSNGTWVYAEELKAGDTISYLMENCQTCGIAFVRKFKPVSAPFCSKTCHNRWAANLGREKLREIMLESYKAGKRDSHEVTKQAHARVREIAVDGRWSEHFEKTPESINQQRINSAITRQLAGCNRDLPWIGFGEPEVYAHIQSLGFKPIPQFALEGYNFDFRVNEDTLLEVDGLGFGQAQYDARRVAKAKIAQKHGYRVLYVSHKNPEEIVDLLRNDQHDYQYAEVEVLKVEHRTGRDGEWSLAVAEDESFVAQGALHHNCQPPGNKLSGARYEQEAISHCSQFRDPVLNEPHKIYFAMGDVATRTILGLPKSWNSKKHKQEDWHGVPIQWGEKWVIPSFHPAHALRKPGMLGVIYYDIQVGLETLKNGFTKQDARLVIDPSPEWFSQWIDSIPPNSPIACDIETTGKLGADEAELEDLIADSWIRINFAWQESEGITVPVDESYLPLIKKLLNSNRVKYWWNKPFDLGVLRAAQCYPAEPNYDMMLAWHMLQSDLPKGLGFVSPFYSGYGAWKHLSGTNPGQYAAIDAVQTIRCANGIRRDLESVGLWDRFLSHIHEFDLLVFNPAHEEGVKIDVPYLTTFQENLSQEESRLTQEILSLVPAEARKTRTPWKRKPEGVDNLIEFTVEEEVLCCDQCGKENVRANHKCPKPKTTKPRKKKGEVVAS